MRETRPEGSRSRSAQVSAAPIVHSSVGGAGSTRIESVPHSRSRITPSSIIHSLAATSVLVEAPVVTGHLPRSRDPASGSYHTSVSGTHTLRYLDLLLTC